MNLLPSLFITISTLDHNKFQFLALPLKTVITFPPGAMKAFTKIAINIFHEVFFNNKTSLANLILPSIKAHASWPEESPKSTLILNFKFPCQTTAEVNVSENEWKKPLKQLNYSSAQLKKR